MQRRNFLKNIGISAAWGAANGATLLGANFITNRQERTAAILEGKGVKPEVANEIAKEERATAAIICTIGVTGGVLIGLSHKK